MAHQVLFVLATTINAISNTLNFAKRSADEDETERVMRLEIADSLISILGLLAWLFV